MDTLYSGILPTILGRWRACSPWSVQPSPCSSSHCSYWWWGLCVEILTGYETHQQDVKFRLKVPLRKWRLFSFQQINVGLLIFSATGFLLPGYLFYHRRNLLRAKATRDRLAGSRGDKECVPLSQSDGGAAGSPADKEAPNGYTPNGHTAWHNWTKQGQIAKFSWFEKYKTFVWAETNFHATTQM